MILSIVMVLSLVPSFSLTAFADAAAVSYLAPVYESGKIKFDSNNDVVFLNQNGYGIYRCRKHPSSVTAGKYG